MRYGIREVADMVLKAKADITLGDWTIKKGQPVLYIDSAKTTQIEGSAESSYATGGRGNARLISWESDKTLTFTVEDALISPISASILTGAGLFKSKSGKVNLHKTANAIVSSEGVIDLSDALVGNETIAADAPIFVVVTEADGSITGEVISGLSISSKTLTGASGKAGSTVFVDFYVVKDGSGVSELQIDPALFGGYFYVEAATLFRRQHDGIDAPVQITMPNVKVQSKFNFNMANSGDPSTFSFVMDALPGYTMFNKTKKVQMVMQIVEDATASAKIVTGVMTSPAPANIPETLVDSKSE